LWTIRKEKWEILAEVTFRDEPSRAAVLVGMARLADEAIEAGEEPREVKAALLGGANAPGALLDGKSPEAFLEGLRGYRDPHEESLFV
jgi:hypothetical protein